MAPLTLIFTRSVGTLQPTRPLGRVGSKFNWPSEDQCQRSHSKWVFVFIPHLKSKYSQLIVSKLSRNSAICPRRSSWRLIVLVRSLRSARNDFIRVWFAEQGCVADRPIKCRHFIRVWFVTCMICNVYDFIRVWFATRMVLNTYNF